MSQSLPTAPSYSQQWPQPAAVPANEPRFAYHRLMKRDPQYRWWRPLAVGSTALGFYLILLVVLVVAMVIMVAVNPTLWADTDMVTSETVNMTDPSEFILTMLSLIILIPACFTGYLLLGPKPVGLLLSVTGKLRFKWLGVCTLAALIVYVIYFGLSFALEALGIVAPTEVPAESIPASPLLMILLVLLLVPFQAAAEEYLFRGLLMQTIGSWLKHPLFAILIPIPLFVLGHLYDIYGQIDVAVFALAAGYLTWRTGGLEAAIGLHVVNNVIIFVLGSVGLADMNATESTLASLISSVCLTVFVTFLMVYLANRFKIERTAGPAPIPPQPQYLAPWPVPYQQGYPQQPGIAQPAFGYYPQVQPPVPPAHPTGAFWAPPEGMNPPAYPPTQPTPSEHNPAQDTEPKQ